MKGPDAQYLIFYNCYLTHKYFLNHRTITHQSYPQGFFLATQRSLAGYKADIMEGRYLNIIQYSVMVRKEGHRNEGLITKFNYFSELN